MFEYPGFLEVSRCFQNVFPPWSFLLHVVAITIQLLADYTDTMVHYLTLSSQVRMDWMILFDVVPWQGMKRRWAHQTVWYLAYLLYNIYICIISIYYISDYICSTSISWASQKPCQCFEFLAFVLGFKLTAGGIIRLVGLAGGGEAVGQSPWECETIRKGKNYI